MVGLLWACLAGLEEANASFMDCRQIPVVLTDLHATEHGANQTGTRQSTVLISSVDAEGIHDGAELVIRTIPQRPS